MRVLFHFANPARFNRLSAALSPVLAAVAAVLLCFGLYDALLLSPPDYQQGDAVRIMYVHVPSAWIALFLYASLGVAGISLIVWKHLLSGVYIRAAAPVGAIATAICLVTGSLWGQPMWGTWWVWDARLTSVLILFFLYLGVIFLQDAFERREFGMVSAAWLAVIGLINLPVIRYSVVWWNSLHQPASISSLKRMADPALSPDMLRPLLVMALGLLALCLHAVLLRMRALLNAQKEGAARG